VGHTSRLSIRRVAQRTITARSLPKLTVGRGPPLSTFPSDFPRQAPGRCIDSRRSLNRD
jgi:hypothetical protein